MGSPAFEKDNAFTRLIHRTAEINADGGHVRGPGPITLGSGPNVRSAAMDPPPLSAEEQAARDRLARDIGIIPKVEEEDDTPSYSSLEEAMATGEAVNHRVANRMTARELIATNGLHDTDRSSSALAVPRLPDFRKVEGFDFFRNVIYLDGLEFPIPEEDIREMKGYAVQIALDHIVKSLAEALMAFGLSPAVAAAAAEKLKEGVTDGSTETVQVRVDGHLGGESSGESVPVPDVRSDREHGVAETEREPASDTAEGTAS